MRKGKGSRGFSRTRPPWPQIRQGYKEAQGANANPSRGTRPRLHLTPSRMPPNARKRLPVPHSPLRMGRDGSEAPRPSRRLCLPALPRCNGWQDQGGVQRHRPVAGAWGNDDGAAAFRGDCYRIKRPQRREREALGPRCRFRGEETDAGSSPNRLGYYSQPIALRMPQTAAVQMMPAHRLRFAARSASSFRM